MPDVAEMPVRTVLAARNGGSGEPVETLMNTFVELFACTQCGFCCQGETTVSLDDDDQARMVAALGLDRSQVRERYWTVTGSTVQMKTVDGRCIFYNDGCTVYHGRPWRCAQWPLVPALCLDENNFTTISESCPGINKELGFAQFRSSLLALNAAKRRT